MQERLELFRRTPEYPDTEQREGKKVGCDADARYAWRVPVGVCAGIRVVPREDSSLRLSKGLFLFYGKKNIR